MSVDMSKTVAPKSDQINSDDCLSAPLTGIVERVYSTGSAEQPVAIKLSCHEQPFKPCKGQRRVLIELWGVNGDSFCGKAMTITRDPTVRYGGIEVGGLVVSHVSHIDKERVISVTVSKGKKKPQIVRPLVAYDVLALSQKMEQVTDTAGMDACRATFSKLSSKLTPEQRTALVALADAAKARIATPVVHADAKSETGKVELL